MSSSTPLADSVSTFSKSSAFTPGDAYSFRVRIADRIELPGKFDPSLYLQFNPRIVGRVAVVCPANGGLCAELLRRGASEVVAFEPRNQYFKAIAAVAQFVERGTGRTFIVHTRMPTVADGEFETIFWPEGLEDLRDPKTPFEQTLACLAPGGNLYIEVHHGTHGPLPKNTNCWRPTTTAFEQSIASLGSWPIRAKFSGRNALRQIYTIHDARERVVEEVAPSEPQAPVRGVEIPLSEAVTTNAVERTPPELRENEELAAFDEPSDVATAQPSEQPVTPRRGRRKAHQ